MNCLEIRCLGPCSVAALKVGMLDLKWDTSEIYRLLNGNQRSTSKILFLLENFKE